VLREVLDHRKDIHGNKYNISEQRTFLVNKNNLVESLKVDMCKSTLQQHQVLSVEGLVLSMWNSPIR
jgi:hypothetical protein